MVVLFSFFHRSLLQKSPIKETIFCKRPMILGLRILENKTMAMVNSENFLNSACAKALRSNGLCNYVFVCMRV